MLKILLPVLLLLFSATALADITPINDNLLFAFDKCRSFEMDLKKASITEVFSKPFDLHCVQANSDKKLFKCDYFDTASNKKGNLENFSGGKTEKVGALNSKGGSAIRFLLSKESANFESSELSSDGLRQVRKICIGIFLLEREALKRKK